ncbi:MAG: hypothetical protein R3B68_08140 [Phycisphaerales bacterium]
MGSALMLGSVVATAIVVAVLLRDALQRKHDVLSWKHLFLWGFLVFFGTGGIFTVVFNAGSELYVASDQAKAIMGICVPLFLVLFLIACGWGLKARWVEKIVPPVDVPQTTPGVLICTAAAVGLLVASLAFPARGDSLLTAIIAYFRGGMSVTAAGLATYWLLAQRFNPLSWAVFIGTIGISLIASISGESGRRQLLGVLIIVPWVWYYTHLRYQRLGAWVPKAAIVMAAGFVLLVGYSGVRAGLRGDDRSVGTLTSALMQSATSADLSTRNLLQDLFLQDAATNSMYIIDTYGPMHEQQPLRGLIWMVVNPIPRALWPEKPDALGLEITGLLNAQGNLAPGIIGHGWAEVGFVGVIYYALAFGFICGAVDRLLQVRAANPFFVIAFGSTIGQQIGMSRGDTPLFLLQSVLTIGMAMGVMYACKIPFNSLMAAFPRLRTGATEAQEGDEAAAYEDADEAEEGHADGLDDAGREAGGVDAAEPVADAGDGGRPVEQPDDWGTYPVGSADWGQASAGWAYSEPAGDAEPPRA